jgi:hypothetical protein
MKRPLAVLFVAAMALGTVGCKEQPMPEFKKFEPAGGKFSVLIPGTPKETRQNAPSQVGQLSITMYVSELPGNRGFTVGITDLPKGSSFDYIGGINGAAAKVKGTVTASNEITMDGKAGREGFIKAPNGLTVRMQMCAVGERVYQLQAVGNDAFVKSDDAKKFFDSFKILP